MCNARTETATDKKNVQAVKHFLDAWDVFNGNVAITYDRDSDVNVLVCEPNEWDLLIESVDEIKKQMGR